LPDGPASGQNPSVFGSGGKRGKDDRPDPGSSILATGAGPIPCSATSLTFEGGTSFDLGRSLTLSGSLYDVPLWGSQKVYSRVVGLSGQCTSSGWA